MIDAVKRLLWPLVRAAHLDAPWVLLTATPPIADGWVRSYREGRSVDREGRPLPWLTYPAIEFLGRRVAPGMHVFEYGSGSSTAWWAARVATVDSVEHDRDWFLRTVPNLPPNARLEHVALGPDGRYARQVLGTGRRFDIVVIDGRDRARCAEIAPEALSESGVILFDNTDRPRYADAIARLLQRGFRRIEFVGMTPIAPAKTETSIFYRSGNCLGI